MVGNGEKKEQGEQAEGPVREHYLGTRKADVLQGNLKLQPDLFTGIF